MAPVERSPLQDHSLSEARNWFRALLHRVLEDGSPRATRPIHFEPLETRQLMASDFFSSASGYSNALDSSAFGDSAYYQGSR